MGKLPEIPGYEVRDELGHGGMGVVYRATHLQLGREVALKLVLEGMSKDERASSRFMREIRSLMAAQHPNVVRVYDSGEVDGRWYYTMELLEAQPLDEVVKAGVRFAVAQALSVLRQACDALAYIHARGMVHRDLKPANLMLSKAGRLTVMDFGLVHVDGATLLTAAGQIVGTPGYLPPDTLMQREQVASGDIYAMGVVCYELLTAKRCFYGPSLKEVLEAIVRGRYTPIHEIVPEVPEGVVQLLTSMMARDAAARPTAEAAVKEIDRLLADPVPEASGTVDPAALPRPRTTARIPRVTGRTARITSTNPSLPVTAPTPTVRRPAWIAPAAGAAALALLAGAFALRSMRSGPATSPSASATAATRPVLSALKVVAQPPRRVRVEPEITGAGDAELACEVRAGDRTVARAPLPGGAPAVLSGLEPGGSYEVRVLLGDQPLPGPAASIAMPRAVEHSLEIVPGDRHLTVAVRCLEKADFEVSVRQAAGGGELFRSATRGNHRAYHFVKGLKPRTAYTVALESLDPKRYFPGEPMAFETQADGHVRHLKELVQGIFNPVPVDALTLAERADATVSLDIAKALEDPNVRGDSNLLHLLTRALATAHDPRVLPTLVNVSQEITDPEQRIRFVYALGKIYEPAAFDTIARLGTSIPQNPEQVSMFACALARSDPDRAPRYLQQLAREWKTRTPSERLAAACGIVELRSSPIAPDVAAMAIGANDRAVTILAARSLARVGTEPCRAGLVKLLGAHSTPGQRLDEQEAVLVALSRCATPAEAPALRPFAEAPHPPRIRAAAAHALAGCGAGESGRLLKLVDEPDPFLAGTAALALARLGIKEAVPKLTARLGCGAPTAGRVPRALGMLGAPSAADRLHELAKQTAPAASRSEAADRADALWALAQLRDPRALALARAHLTASDEYVRVRAAEAVGCLGDKTDAGALEAMATRAPPALRAMLETALGWLRRGARPPGKAHVVDAGLSYVRTGEHIVAGDKLKLHMAGAWAELSVAGALKSPAGGGSQVNDAPRLACVGEVGPSGLIDQKTGLANKTLWTAGELVLSANGPPNPDGIGFMTVWVDVSR